MMNWHEITLQPRDLLFFRDARPMAADSVGHGAKIPLPHVLHDALTAAFHERWPGLQEWEFEHVHCREGEKGRMRFGGLKTLGVFLSLNEEIYFHAPSDISADGKDVARLWNPPGKSNLPAPLKYLARNNVQPGKQEIGEWISASELGRYLTGKPFTLTKTDELYRSESWPGIGIDPNTHSTEESKFYLAEYIRLKTGVSLKGYATCETACGEKNTGDVIEKYFSGEIRDFIFGGQRGTVFGSISNGKPEFVSLVSSTRLKWVLLSPAIFAAGWKPGWVSDDGRVLLPANRPKRLRGESRLGWRSKFGKPVDARLIAARLPKPVAVSGWNLRTGGPRATRLAVPAGAVYYFEAATEDDALALARTLTAPGGKSDLLGEKGYGFGICGSWDFAEK